MDPTRALTKLRDLLGGDHSGHQNDDPNSEDYDPDALTPEDTLTLLCAAEETFQGLDEWILKGGVLPHDWIASTTNTAYGLALRHLCETIRNTQLPINTRVELAMRAAGRVIRGGVFS